MNKLKLTLPIIALGLFSCTKEPVDKCSDNHFELHNLHDGAYLETDVSQDRVNMLFQILDKQGKGVIDFNDNTRFSLLDANQEMMGNVEADVRIEPFGSIPTEINTAILLDISKSVEGFVPQIKEAAIEFINLSLAEQRIAIYTFDGDPPVLRQNYTNNKNLLISAINSLPNDNLGTSTNLYEALEYAEGELPYDQYSTTQIRQGSLLVFTDGRETANPTSQALQSLLYRLEDRTVFVAALNSPDLDENTLRKIAGADANYFQASNINELKEKFAQIQSDIERLSKSVYWLYYTSPRKGSNDWDIELSIKDNCYKGPYAKATGTYNSFGF